MNKVKNTIKYGALYSSGDVLKLFSQCAEIENVRACHIYESWKGITSWTRSNSGKIGLFTLWLLALEHQ